MKRMLTAPVAYWALLAPCGPATAQTPPIARGDSASADGHTPPAETAVPESAWEPGASLELERERFAYVAAGRRDPFLPLSHPAVAENSSGPDPEVLGIISHSDSSLSVIVVRAAAGRERGDGAPGDPGAWLGSIRRLRLGDSIGNARIVSIREDHIVVETEDSVGVRRRILEHPGARRGVR